MRHFLLLLLPLLFAASCSDDDDTSIRPITGAGVMTCTINSQSWKASPRRFGFQGVAVQYGSSQNRIQVLGLVDGPNASTPFHAFSVYINDPTEGEQAVNENDRFFEILNYTTSSMEEEYTHLPTHPDNLLIIDRLDLDARIVGGRFAGVAVGNLTSDTLIIENGFFDVTF